MRNEWRNCFAFVLVTSRASQSFKIAGNLHLSHPALLLVMLLNKLKIACYLTSGSLLFTNNYC